MTAGLREQAFNVMQSWPGILKSLLMVFQLIDVKQGKAPLGVCNCKIKICKYVICLPTEHQGVDELLQKYTVAQKGQSPISLPKRKSISQNTNQFTKTQNNFSKHKSVYQNTKQFLKTQISLPKHKTISQNRNRFRRNTNQFTKTQINFSKHKPISSKHKSKDWALALLLSENLERTHSQEFPRPTWRLQICRR